MNTFVEIIMITAGLFIALLVCLEAGFRLGRWNYQRSPDTAYEGIGAIEGTVFALLGLLLAFSISGAAGRLDTRRELIVQEANDIGTAYLRIDLLPPDQQPALRSLFREYLDVRLSIYEHLDDDALREQTLTRMSALQAEIWSAAVAAGEANARESTRLLLLPAINDMIDITTTRRVALSTHLPALITLLLIGLSLVAAVAAGYSMSKRQVRSWIHMIGFAALVALTLYVVLDLENPRSGLIRLDSADQVLYELRDSIE
jgi:hypothetical protein